MSGEAWTSALEADLTWQRISARFRYWRDDPPPALSLQMLAVALAGWEPPAKRVAKGHALKELRTLFPAGRL